MWRRGILTNLKAFLLLTVIVSFYSCILDHYKDVKSLKVKTKFPAVHKNTGTVFSKPADASLDYVPPFVDRIEAVVTSNDGEILYSKTVDRSDEGISGELDLGDVPYGNLEAKAYSFNARNPSDQQWIEHPGSQTIVIKRFLF